MCFELNLPLTKLDKAATKATATATTTTAASDYSMRMCAEIDWRLCERKHVEHLNASIV